jgi:DeoR/GlpR family transcriptional regulator of sugar metabolism
MKVAAHVVEARRRRLADLLQRRRYLPVQEICRELGVSEATARRDLAALEKEQKVTRTFGGALSEFNLRFPSFRQRQEVAASAKRRLAQRARSLIPPGATCFFDAGTTIFSLAEALRDNPVRPMTCVTSNLPVAELFATIEGVDVNLLGGQLLPRQSVLLGERACRSAELWEFDYGFFSAEGMTREGLWNSRPEVIALQRAVMARCRLSVFLLDGAKLGRVAPQFLVPWESVGLLVTNAAPVRLEALGVPAEKMAAPGSGGANLQAAGVSGLTRPPVVL